MSHNLHSLLTIAAEMRAVGHSWDAVAAKVQRRPRTCQKWTSRHRSDWEALYHDAQTRRFHETSEEAHTLLKNLMRDDDKKVRYQAIALWVKSGASAYGLTGAMKIPVSPQTVHLYIDEKARLMREGMIIVRRDVDAQRAREGLPPATDEEFDDAFDKYIEELEAARGEDEPPEPAPAERGLGTSPLLVGLLVLVATVIGRLDWSTGDSRQSYLAANSDSRGRPELLVSLREAPEASFRFREDARFTNFAPQTRLDSNNAEPKQTERRNETETIPFAVLTDPMLKRHSRETILLPPATMPNPVSKQPAACPGPVGLTRRNMLQIGGVGAFNLALPQVLAASDRMSQVGLSPKADSCILVFLNGGPSHLDMWDMKPDLPQEMRSEFKPIATTVPGIQVCEHLPRLSRRMSNFALVRSVYHDQVAHAPAVYTALTGIRSNVCAAGIMGAKATDHPAVGSVVGSFRPPNSQVMPYVLTPYLTAEGAGGPPQPGFLGGWMGKTTDPFLVLQGGGRPDGFNLPALIPGIGMTSDRVHDRRGLLEGLTQRGSISQAGQELGNLQARACDLLTSPAAQRAFQLEKESDRVRDAYGRNIYGQSMLLARRLVEAGTRLTCVSWAPDANATWDTHGGNFTTLKNRLLPPFDASMSCLLDDLRDRGLLERTLVVVMGEIGRTPKINGGAGRDHWEFCYTVLMAGGGVKGGFTYGASDKRGAYPKTSPVTASDIIATVYHGLGIPADMEIRDRQDRPVLLVPEGTPIRELFA